MVSDCENDQGGCSGPAGRRRGLRWGRRHELFTEKQKHKFDTNIADRLNAAWVRINADKGRADRGRLEAEIC
jgi:hypothetical protein